MTVFKTPEYLKEGYSPFQRVVSDFVEAAGSGDITTVTQLLGSHGPTLIHARVTPDSLTGFIKAVCEGQKDIVALLLEHGAHVDETTECDHPALLAAAIHGHADIMQLLLDKGAAINREGKAGWTALTGALNNGHGNIVRILVENGLDINARNSDGETNFILAAKHGNSHAMEMLLENGAIINARDKNSDTALIWARRKGYTRLAEKIEEWDVANLKKIKEDTHKGIPRSLPYKSPVKPPSP